MKTCNGCSIEKDESQFYFRNGRLAAECKGCEKQKAQERASRHRQNASAPEAKTCPVCQVEKPITAFNLNRSGPTGHAAYCKQCVSAYNKSRLKPVVAAEKVIPEEKHCPGCDQVKPRAAFYRSSYRPNGLSCWCIKCQKKAQARIRDTNPESCLLAQAKNRAKSKKIPFNIDITDIVMTDKCPVLGIEWRSGGNDTVPSLDKIDPAKGYVKGNIVVVSMRANRLKNDATPDELRRLADFYGSL